MRSYRLIAVLAAMLGFSAFVHADNGAGIVKKAVGRSTLNQHGTKPFHLRAVLAPSRDSDRDSKRTGEVEIWWASPTQYRREVRSPEFHQIAIVNGGHEWQKNEGDYFPEWLREVAVALIDPVPSLDQVLERVKGADIKKLRGNTYFSWNVMSTDGNIQTSSGAGVSITDGTGLLFYGGGFGWGGMYHDYQSFHGRMVGRTVSAGTPEVTAKVTMLEDLQDVPPGFFDAEASGGDTPLLHTVLVEETSLRKNLLPMEPAAWPPLQEGPLEGALSAEISVDRTGKVREVGTIVGSNQGVNEVARDAIAAMRFQPYLQEGVAVQVVSRVSMAFKTVRPAGVETFESARAYFERGRHVGFPAIANGPPYVLQAVFRAKVSAGTLEDGHYVDTWKSDSEWRREASIDKSRYVRTRLGEKGYELAEGPDVSLLRAVLRVTEPIPAMDTFVESDWKIKRDTIDGEKTVRVLTGYESLDGTLDPEHARGYWFDETGKLVKTYFMGIETRRSAFEDFGGAQIAHQIKVLSNGGLVMFINVTQVSPAGNLPANMFKLRGHKWTRAFTDEAR
jgi:hypothetical protein